MRAWLVAVVVPVSFAFGGLLSLALPQIRSAHRAPTNQPSIDIRLRLLLLGLLAVGLAEQAHQFILAGTVPLFSANIDAARFALPGGPTTVLRDLLTVAAIVALTVPRNLASRRAIFELSVGATVVAAFALEASRASMLLPIVVALFARMLYWGRPSLRTLAVLGAVVITIFTAMFFARTTQHPNNPVERQLHATALSNESWPTHGLLPVYVALAAPTGLAAVVDYFPQRKPFGHGVYDLVAFDLVAKEARSIRPITGVLTPPFVTATIAGPLWADGGFAAVFFGLAIVGFLSVGAFTYARRTREFRYSLVAAYLLYLTLFGIYANLFTQYPDWLIVSPLLLLLGSLAQRSHIAAPDAQDGERDPRFPVQSRTA